MPVVVSCSQRGDLADRVRAGRQAGRLRSTPGIAARIHVPCGPGWALAGDAGLLLDPVSAHGISRALGDAELLAGAVIAGLGGRDGVASALAGYHRERDRAARPVGRLSGSIARLAAPGAAERLLYGWLAGQPAAITRFFGVLAGVETLGHFRRSATVLRALARPGRRLAA